MKTIYCFIFCLLVSVSHLYAQSVSTGISVQGIARNTDKTALVSKDLTFTFTLKDESGTTVYNETATITTDAFGVFAHTIGTGNATTGPFEDLMFHHEKLSLVISVEIDGVVTEISNSPFQYTAYAKSADNGVPTGSIMPYVGSTAPPGWVLCNGQSLTGVTGSGPLIALLGGNNAPDLRGMFLRGTGTSPVNGKSGPALNASQQDGFETHSVSVSTSSAGNHSHQFNVDTGGGGGFGGGAMLTASDFGNFIANSRQNTFSSGSHTHTITGSSSGGTNETRPVNYGINYIIRL